MAGVIVASLVTSRVMPSTYVAWTTMRLAVSRGGQVDASGEYATPARPRRGAGRLLRAGR